MQKPQSVCIIKNANKDNVTHLHKYSLLSINNFSNGKCAMGPKKNLNSKSNFNICTGKYFSEALTIASTNPQYDKRLFIELQV